MRPRERIEPVHKRRLREQEAKAKRQEKALLEREMRMLAWQSFERYRSRLGEAQAQYGAFNAGDAYPAPPPPKDHA